MDFKSHIKQSEEEKGKSAEVEDYPVRGVNEPVWMEIEDIDNDGNPEIMLIISGLFKFVPYFNLYIEISENRLKVDLNPKLYKPFFEQEKHKSQTNLKTDQYFIYGFLSNELNLKEIERALGNDRKELITDIKQIENLNQDLHEVVNEENFYIEDYHLRKE